MVGVSGNDNRLRIALDAAVRAPQFYVIRGIDHGGEWPEREGRRVVDRVEAVMTITPAAEAVPKKPDLELTDNARNDLAMIADRLGISWAEALARAIGTLAVLVEQERAGTQIILKQTNGIRQTLPLLERGEDGGRGRHR